MVSVPNKRTEWKRQLRRKKSLSAWQTVHRRLNAGVIAERCTEYMLYLKPEIKDCCVENFREVSSNMDLEADI